jgi:hypothetical protein
MVEEHLFLVIFKTVELLVLKSQYLKVKKLVRYNAKVFIYVDPI